MRIYHALLNSLRALRRGFRTEPALQQEICIAIVLVPAALWLSSNSALLIFSLFLVISVEALNTAVEKLCDRMVPEFDADIGYVKDLGSLAVLCAIIGAGILWIHDFRWVVLLVL